MINPTNEQKQAIDAIKKWYKDRYSRQYFYMAGYAGTGKTSLVPVIVDALGLDPYNPNNVLYGSYTGKAALVLRKKGLHDATTIHSMIYIAIEDQETKQVYFDLNPVSQVCDTKLIILDECSMIDEKIAEDLMSFGKKILVIGDPGQLPPVNGHGVFTRQQPDFFLEEIHRQAAENPIIRIATYARLGEKIPFGNYDNKVFKIKHDDLKFEAMLEYDQILTGKNITRQTLNKSFKDNFGYTNVLPTSSGAKLVCLKNNHNVGVLNGMLFFTMADNCNINTKGKKFTQTLINDDGKLFKNIKIFTGYFNYYNTKMDKKAQETEIWNHRRLCHFDWGYALTVHKSQGSQWENVLCYDDGFGMMDRELRSQWLYTAITRASENLLIASKYE